MRKVIYLVTGAATLGLLGILAWQSPWTTDAAAIEGQPLQLQEGTAQFRAVELEALAGSVEAANALMDYHSKCHVRENLNPDLTPVEFDRCVKEIGYWTDIALQNGSRVAAQRQTNFLLESSRCSDIYRAEYWYGQFKSYYASDRVFLKSVADHIAEKKRSCRW